MKLTDRYEIVAPDNLEKGDVVWVKWYHSSPYNYDVQAFPTIIYKIYDDGNILHDRYGYERDFAFKNDIVAKTPPGWNDYMEHLHVPLRDVEFEMRDQRQAALEKKREMDRVNEAAKQATLAMEGIAEAAKVIEFADVSAFADAEIEEEVDV